MAAAVTIVTAERAGARYSRPMDEDGIAYALLFIALTAVLLAGGLGLGWLVEQARLVRSIA